MFSHRRGDREGLVDVNEDGMVDMDFDETAHSGAFLRVEWSE